MTESMKVCNGPSHPEPILLPISEFYVRKSRGREGEVVSRCKRCCNWDKLKFKNGSHGTIPADQIREIVRELVNRVGQTEALRISGLAQGTLTAILNGNTQRVQKQTAGKILLATRELRRNGIVYHKKDISAGISRKVKNGMKFRPVTEPSQQYGPIYPDLEAGMRRKRALTAQQKREDELDRLAGY